jgi:hypothetical protein
MRWQGQTYIDGTLPFGLRSAPLVFSAVADALEWVVRTRGVHNIFHYIDDFIIIGAPRSDECANCLGLFLSTCEALGMLISRDKTEGPAFRMTILGIQVDTVAMTLSLPEEKLHRTLVSVGVDPAPSAGHSFRRGAATSAAAAGVEDAVIKILGRWSSSAYMSYIRMPQRNLAEVSRRLVV